MSTLTFIGVPVWPSTGGFIRGSVAGDFVLLRRAEGLKLVRVYFHPAPIASMSRYAQLWEAHK